MRISDVLRHKGDFVATIRPEQSVRELLEMLARLAVGALVVTSQDGGDVVGIVSERDVVRALQRTGDPVLDGPVEAIMTKAVATCQPTDRVDDVMRLMTEQRVRHVPVLVDGRLAGIVSIGDVVKNRMDELQDERDHLTAYISS
ncbi:MAG: CBS domain-containing protein [Mycobacteriales bacterium]